MSGCFEFHGGGCFCGINGSDAVCANEYRSGGCHRPVCHNLHRYCQSSFFISRSLPSCWAFRPWRFLPPGPLFCAVLLMGMLDLIVTLFTLSRGKIAVMAKAAKKSLKRFPGCPGGVCAHRGCLPQRQGHVDFARSQFGKSPGQYSIECRQNGLCQLLG